MNLPNKLSLLRLCLIPVCIVLMVLPGTACRMAALAVFAIASLTDTLDGHIARSRNLVTDFGKFVDPLADKALVMSVLIVMCGEGLVPAIPLAVMMVRDLAVDGLRLLLASKGTVMAAGKSGKIKTVLQMAAILLLFLHSVLFTAFPLDLIVFYLATAMSVYSGVEYLYKNRQAFSEA